MAADQHQDLTSRDLAPHVERTAERELLSRDVCDRAAVLFRDLQGPVGGTRIDHDDFNLEGSSVLLADGLEQFAQVAGLGQCADAATGQNRSAESTYGKEVVSTCRTRWSQDH